MDEKIMEKLQAQNEQSGRPYYAIVIPVGNIRDTVVIGETLEKGGIGNWLGSYEGLDYSNPRIRPATLVGLKIIDGADWFKKKMERLKKSIEKQEPKNNRKEKCP